ncbi:hypothetical protein ACH436_15065 [Isoptericola sp. NPDC019693]|uniref:hypothetical protein n=1 Tax=Isoptericola sp. NPDC019693 TaxID=3364009 RepID=UPI00379331DB
MIELAGPDAPGEVAVEFDEYVPVTATWPAYERLSSPPTYVRAVEQHRLLELKFDPVEHDLAELVLVNAPGARSVEQSFAAQVADAPVTARWSGGPEGYEYPRLDIAYYQDCVLMTFSTETFRDWRGRGPVFFGILDSGLVGAVGIRWGGAANRRLATHEPGS